MVENADIIFVVGTSLNVYPAAGLLYHAQYNARKILIDPNEMQVENIFQLQHFKEKAGDALPRVVDELIAEFSA
jgi:NAD-dependent deacetylase